MFHVHGHVLGGPATDLAARVSDPAAAAQTLRRDLDRRLAEQQAEWRSPGLAGAVVRSGAPVWDGVGRHD